MALKSTIFKASLSVADIDHAYYADHALTLARHPSEADERPGGDALHQKHSLPDSRTHLHYDARSAREPGAVIRRRA